MGDMAEYYQDLEWESQFGDEQYDLHYNGIHYKNLLILYFQGNLFWETKKSEKIRIQDMDKKHLLNTIKFLNKTDRTCMIEIRNILLIEKYNRKI